MTVNASETVCIKNNAFGFIGLKEALMPSLSSEVYLISLEKNDFALSIWFKLDLCNMFFCLYSSFRFSSCLSGTSEFMFCKDRRLIEQHKPLGIYSKCIYLLEKGAAGWISFFFFTALPKDLGHC